MTQIFIYVIFTALIAFAFLGIIAFADWVTKVFKKGEKE